MTLQDLMDAPLVYSWEHRTYEVRAVTFAGIEFGERCYLKTPDRTATFVQRPERCFLTRAEAVRDALEAIRKREFDQAHEMGETRTRLARLLAEAEEEADDEDDTAVFEERDMAVQEPCS